MFFQHFEQFWRAVRFDIGDRVQLIPQLPSELPPDSYTTTKVLANRFYMVGATLIDAYDRAWVRQVQIPLVLAGIGSLYAVFGRSRFTFPIGMCVVVGAAILSKIMARMYPAYPLSKLNVAFEQVQELHNMEYRNQVDAKQSDGKQVPLHYPESAALLQTIHGAFPDVKETGRQPTLAEICHGRRIMANKRAHAIYQSHFANDGDTKYETNHARYLDHERQFERRWVDANGFDIFPCVHETMINY